jgi:hypothetical protein
MTVRSVKDDRKTERKELDFGEISEDRGAFREEKGKKEKSRESGRRSS